MSTKDNKHEIDNLLTQIAEDLKVDVEALEERLEMVNAVAADVSCVVNLGCPTKPQ